MRLLSLLLALLLLSGCDRGKPMPDNENAVTAFALQHFVDNDEITGAVRAMRESISRSTRQFTANAALANNQIPTMPPKRFGVTIQSSIRFGLMAQRAPMTEPELTIKAAAM